MTGRRRTRIRTTALAAAALLAACSAGDPFEPLPQPASVPPPSSTTVPPDYSGVVLASVQGATTTTEVVIGPGPTTLAGTVSGPDGPVEGATVRLERLVGDAAAAMDVTTAGNGAWQAPGVLGGRYRIRAWRSPDLALIAPQILFVDAGRPPSVALTLERFEALTIDIAIAPDPPQVGTPVNLRVRIAFQVVDDDGVVRATPQPGVTVALGTGTGWSATSPLQTGTDAAGGATFTLVCRAPGSQPLTVSLPGRPPPGGQLQPAGPGDSPPAPASPPPEVFDLEVPDCVAPPSPTVPAPVTTTPSTSLIPSEG